MDGTSILLAPSCPPAGDLAAPGTIDGETGEPTGPDGGTGTDGASNLP